MYSVIRNKLISLDANEGEIVALSEADAKASSVIEGSYNLEPNKYKSKYSRRTISLIYLSRSLRTTDKKLQLNNNYAIIIVGGKNESTASPPTTDDTSAEEICVKKGAKNYLQSSLSA